MGVAGGAAPGQAGHFLPLTNEPSPEEEDDADDSEVRDTFMVGRKGLFRIELDLRWEEMCMQVDGKGFEMWVAVVAVIGNNALQAGR